MKQILIATVLIFVLVKGVIWLIDTSNENPAFLEPRDRKANIVTKPEPQPTLPESEQIELQPESTDQYAPTSPNDVTEGDGSFPAPTVQIVNGRPERTIHMGVRQYAWDPSVITAKKGELVRLIVHNADVKHGLVIPDLNVLNIDIPPEGAVIEFEASKVGTFAFFCSYYCGEDHSMMRGKIVIE